MALKFNLNISDKEIDNAVSERPGRYDGPTPPDGFYQAKVRKVWSGENKNGPVFKVSIKIAEPEGTDNAVYNGYDFIENITIPTDNQHQYFTIQVDVLDNFLKAASGGTYGMKDFVKDANAGRIAEDGEEDKIGQPIKSIGKLKLDGNGPTFKVKTKNREYNGKTYTNVHYFDNSDLKITPSNSADEDPWSDDDFADDDDLLGQLEDE